MIYSFFSAMLPALFFSLLLTFRFVAPCISAVYHVFAIVPSSLVSPVPVLSFFLSFSLSLSLSFFFLLGPILRVSLLRRVRPYARTCASKRSNAPASQHGPAPSSCIAVSLDLHDPHESPRDSLPTSELRWTKEKSKTVRRYTDGTWVHFSILYVDINNFEIHRN